MTWDIVWVSRQGQWGTGQCLTHVTTETCRLCGCTDEEHTHTAVRHVTTTTCRLCHTEATKLPSTTNPCGCTNEEHGLFAANTEVGDVTVE